MYNVVYYIIVSVLGLYVFFSLPASTLGSIISQLVQRSMKGNYRKSPSIASKYYELYETLMSGNNKGNVILK